MNDILSLGARWASMVLQDGPAGDKGLEKKLKGAQGLGIWGWAAWARGGAERCLAQAHPVCPRTMSPALPSNAVCLWSWS